MLKFDTLVHDGSPEAAELLQSTFVQIQDGERLPNLENSEIAITQPRVIDFSQIWHAAPLWVSRLKPRTRTTGHWWDGKPQVSMHR